MMLHNSCKKQQDPEMVAISFMFSGVIVGLILLVELGLIK